MTHLFRELQRREARNQPVRTAVVGAGFMGKGIVYQLSKMPGMRPSLVVNRSTDKGVQAYVEAGYDRAKVVVSDDVDRLAAAIAEGRPAVSGAVGIAGKISTLDVVIEATGAVEGGAREALSCFAGKKHFVSLNAETDGTIGCLLKARGDQAGVVYTNADGDQPGVIMRMAEWCAGCGFEVLAAVNCKGFMNIRATPDSIMEWAVKQRTSPRMTCAFTDGTKMNIEQNVVCNATGLVPAKRGMIGVKTDLKNAVKDFESTGALGQAIEGGPGIVDYTLAGDFGGGIFIIARGKNREFVQPYLKYLKMGDGPNYMFFRPYHLCHIETPLSAAEAVVYGEATIAPRGRPVAQTIAVAKRDLKPGDVLDGIGGFNQYGELEIADKARGLLPIGLADGVKLKRAIKQDQPIPEDAVELDEESLLVRLWREQERM
ncbi:MAG: NAD(P)H-dependent oxidoreductase [Phycisphaerae bacterium]|nr:SAF domain-containing protein [Tepidisphaeraceae bacterium]